MKTTMKPIRKLISSSQICWSLPVRQELPRSISKGGPRNLSGKRPLQFSLSREPPQDVPREPLQVPDPWEAIRKPLQCCICNTTFPGSLSSEPLGAFPMEPFWSASSLLQRGLSKKKYPGNIQREPFSSEPFQGAFSKSNDPCPK